MTTPAGGSAAARRIVLGVSGGIAAYKACELLRRLTEAGHDVTVVPTEAALRFVGEPTWSALSGKPVRTSVWDDVHRVPHVRLGQEADLVVVAPATADLMARAAHGLADDLLSSTLLTARCPVVLAPAMHTEMWEHPATRDNVATLRARGVLVVEPASGRLTGADSGPGRLPEPAAIAEVCERVLARGSAGVAVLDLAGLTVLVSAGGTREPIDPVRFIGNRSSGLQGYALASAAVARGARVVLVSANVSLPDPAGVDVERVETAADLRDAVLRRAGEVEVVVMAAAVADFRPVAVAISKIKKEGADPAAAPAPLPLERTDDVLALTVAARGARGSGDQVIVGFAAETGDEGHSVLDHARAKLGRKGVDLLVVNDVSGGKVFGEARNTVTILGRDGSEAEVPEVSKGDVADVVWDRVMALRTAR